MRYALYALLVIPNLLFTLLAILPPVTFFVAACANEEGWLPKWLMWFQTQDNSLDAGWKIQGNFGTYLTTGTVPTGATRWWYRVCWLWRNPAYGFGYWPLGVAVNAADWTVVINRTDGAESLIFAYTMWHFALLYSGSLGHLKLGWKINAYLQPDGTWASKDWGPEHRTMMAFTPGVLKPWKIPALFRN
jgi:hypothetical protein